MKTSLYANSLLKRLIDIVFSIIILFISLPVFIAISLVILASSSGGIFFLQERSGKNGKIFRMIKFRTMKIGSDKKQKKYSKLNESDGPTFKIREDPRFTGFGRILSHTGLDELPQFFNVILGDMSIVGPRPLPVFESKKISHKDRVREKVRPGITSPWVTHGSHSLSFKKWMELDRNYVREASLDADIKIILQTAGLTFRYILKS